MYRPCTVWEAASYRERLPSSLRRRAYPARRNHVYGSPAPSTAAHVLPHQGTRGVVCDLAGQRRPPRVRRAWTHGSATGPLCALRPAASSEVGELLEGRGHRGPRAASATSTRSRSTPRIGSTARPNATRPTSSKMPPRSPTGSDCNAATSRSSGTAQAASTTRTSSPWTPAASTGSSRSR